MELLPGLSMGKPEGSTAPYRVVARNMWSIWDVDRLVFTDTYIADITALSCLLRQNESQRDRIVMLWNEARLRPKRRFTWVRQGPVYVFPYLEGDQVDLVNHRPDWVFVYRFSSMAGGKTKQLLKIYPTVYLALREDHVVIKPD